MCSEGNNLIFSSIISMGNPGDSGLTISDRAATMGRYCGVFDQPMENGLTYSLGVLAWTYEVAAGDLRDIRLAWRVRWPADKSVVYDGGRS